MYFCFFDRHKVPMKHSGEPHRMKIEIGAYDRKRGAQAVFRDQVRNDPSRHEMRTDGNMWIKFTDKFDKRAGIQAIQHQAHSVRLPWFVALLVPPTEEIGRRLNQARVELGIKIAKHLVSEIK